MTPAVFFRLIMGFTGLMAAVFIILGLMQMFSAHGYLAVPLLFVAAVNVFGYFLFRRLSERSDRM